jgi:hypothetical protein
MQGGIKGTETGAVGMGPKSPRLPWPPVTNEPFGSRSEPCSADKMQCRPAHRTARSRRAGRSSFAACKSMRASALWSPCLNRALPRAEIQKPIGRRLITPTRRTHGGPYPVHQPSPPLPTTFPGARALCESALICRRSRIWARNRRSPPGSDGHGGSSDR